MDVKASSDFVLGSRCASRFSAGRYLRCYLVAGLDMRLANKIDDLSSVDYKSDLSTSLSLSYEVGFFAAAGGLSVLIYIILFITKIANMSVNKTILLSMAHIGSLLQFSIAVHCAILVSKSINPRGKYSNTLPYSLSTSNIIKHSITNSMTWLQPLRFFTGY